VRLILASGSPRRYELLSLLTTDFIVIPPSVDEEGSGPPRERAVAAAVAKAHEVAKRAGGVIIGADTIVAIDDKILGKPRSRDEARRFLAELSGREHQVITGLCVLSTWTGTEAAGAETSSVRFRVLAPSEIEGYLDTEEYVDKAGGYAIQGRGGLFVERICGDYYNVVGLPLGLLRSLLREVGSACSLLRPPSGGESRR